MKIFFGFFALAFISLIDNSESACYRQPQGANGDRSPVDENYQILIDGNPTTYIPGQQYNISLSCANGLKFISFTLLVESDPSSLLNPAAGGDHVLGRFEIIDNAETKFSTLCENMIESSNNNVKTRIDVAWVAPSDLESGCVLFKAAVLQHRNVWFMDDGFLTKRLCPEEIDDVNSQTPQVSPCCACDEAKYEIILERKWMRNTHAKDFPSEAWRTRLGEVIGASHMVNFSFWAYGGLASQGLKELAEHGATTTLENEIKAYKAPGYIRTIIKAPGIIYRSKVVGTTLATVRVDPDHHVISLVSKIIPSPDWILGVAGLELCLANCTWIEKKVLNLYPWDVGTDAGPSYMSPDQAQHPPDVIRRITSSVPSDYRSPFFDAKGAPMKPLATLHVSRKRTYERVCNFEETGPLECSTHPWNEWTECTAKCGAGTQYQMRSYKDAILAESFNCKVVLRRNQNCIGTQCGIQQSEIDGRTSTAECELTSWSRWSECPKICGKGFQTRTRDYINPYAKEKCQLAFPIELEQTRTCSGENCGGNLFTSSYDSNKNDNTFNENFEEDLQQNNYDQSNYDNNRFSTATKRKPWKQEDPTNPPEQFNNKNYNYDNNNYRSQLSRPIMNTKENEEEFVNVNNIYGNEKLVGNSRKPYGNEAGDDNQQQQFNQNFNEDLESENNRNRFSKPYENQFKPSQQFGINVEPKGNFRYGHADNNRPTNLYNFEENKPSFTGNSMYDNRESNLPGYSNSGNDFNNNYNRFGIKTIDQESDSTIPDFCLKKPFPSPIECKKANVIVRNYWFFDADDFECKLFTADDCDLNKNKFRSLEQCERTCSKTGDIMPNNRQQGGYRNRGYEQTQQAPPPSYRSRWN